MTQHTFQVTTINFIYLNPGNFHDPTNILDCWFSRQSNSIGSPKTTPFDIRARYTEPHVVEFERKHKAIIDRFGRYPRTATPSWGAPAVRKKPPSCKSLIPLFDAKFVQKILTFG